MTYNLGKLVCVKMSVLKKTIDFLMILEGIEAY